MINDLHLSVCSYVNRSEAVISIECSWQVKTITSLVSDLWTDHLCISFSKAVQYCYCQWMFKEKLCERNIYILLGCCCCNTSRYKATSAACLHSLHQMWEKTTFYFSIKSRGADTGLNIDKHVSRPLIGIIISFVKIRYCNISSDSFLEYLSVCKV